ncbi:MAG: ankyrin repeat domain-containing protein, partial [Candidatus Lariskella arthropodorum]
MKSEDISSNLTYHELHYAVKKDIKLLENLIKKSKEQVGELLNVQNCSGNTVLHIAAEHNSNSIQLLIEVFKEEVEKLIYVKNNYGNTALHWAARYSQDSLKCRSQDLILQTVIKFIPDCQLSFDCQICNRDTRFHY